MLKIATPKPFATIPARTVGDIIDAACYDSADLGARVPTVIAGAAASPDGTIAGADLYLYRVAPAAGRRMRALAVEFDHWWAKYANNDDGGVTPYWEHWTASNSARWTVDITNGAVLAEVRMRGDSRDDAPVIIIEATASDAVRVHVAGYLSVWTPGGWDHGAKPAAAGAWDADAAGYAWRIAKSLLKAIGATATLPGDAPILA